MKIITPETFDPRRDSGRFPVAINKPLVLLVKEFRSEADYDADPDAEATALRAITHAAGSLTGTLYAVLSEGRIATMSGFRSRKGPLPLNSPLRRLEHSKLEVPIGETKSTLGIVFRLAQYNSGGELGKLLNWLDGVMIVSSLNMEDVCTMASSWLSGEVTRPLGLNYDAIVASLTKYPELVVIRYFPADNGRRESLAVVCNETTANQHALLAFDQMLL